MANTHSKNFRSGFSSNRGRGRFPRFGGCNPRYCDHCHRTNHTSDSGWIKLGVPQDSNLHTKVQPPPLKPSTHASMVDIVSSTANLRVGKDDKDEAQFDFSREQYEALLALIQQSPNDSSSTATDVHQCTTKSTCFVFPFSSWILDSGATDHICPFKSLFQNLKPISPISIQLPNQNSIIAKFSSTIVLGNLILHNLLFVPKFSIQLISIPKFLNSTNCLMVFSQNTCLIVQTDTFQTIGAARKHQGLFYLLDSSQDKRNLSISNTNISLPHSTLINNVTPCNLWHMKLGHPFDKILQFLISDHSDIFFSFYYCL